MVNSVSNQSLSQTQGFSHRSQSQNTASVVATKLQEPTVLTQSKASSSFSLASAAGSGEAQQAAQPQGYMPRGSIVDVLA